MTSVKYADICDAPGCGKRSEEYAGWPTCRACMLDFCPDHTVPGSVQEREHEDFDGHVDGIVQTVYCTLCLATWGAE